MKFSFKIVIVIIVSIMIELCIFNFNYLKNIIVNDEGKNIIYDLEKAQLINWRKSEDIYISQVDPMLIFTDVNTYIKEIEIRTEVDKKIPYIDFFYTNDTNVNFNGDLLISLRETDIEKNVILVNKEVRNIRIDLGDEEGLFLRDFKIIINPNSVSFSLSRVIAMVLIYLANKGLSLLQKNPSYDISQKKEGDKK